MAGSRSTNTFSELLQRLIGDFAEGMSMPDADLEWLAQMQMQVVEKIRQPIAAGQAAGMSQVPPGGAGMPGQPMPPGPGMMPQSPGAMPGQMPGGMPPGQFPGGPPPGMDQMTIDAPVGPGPGGIPRDNGATGMNDELRRMVGQ